jgi:hypothetical protein
MMANKLSGLKVKSSLEFHIAQTGKLLHLKTPSQKIYTGYINVVVMPSQGLVAV